MAAGRARRLRGDTAVLAGPRRRRVPDRRRARPVQGRAAAGRPAGAVAGPAEREVRPAAGLQHEPAGGARRLPGLAADRGQLPAGAAAAGRDLGGRSGPARLLLRPRRRAAAGVQLPVRVRRADRPGPVRRRGEHAGQPAGRGLPGVDGVQPRRRPVPEPLVRRRRAEDPAGPAGAGHAARDDRALLRRRDRDDRRGRPARAAAGPDDPRRGVGRAGQQGPRPHPDAVGCVGHGGIRAGGGEALAAGRRQRRGQRG